MALVEERVSSPREYAEAPRQRPAFSLPLEPALYVALMALGFLARIHQLDGRALHHDESLHALYSWYLYVGRGYVHDPMMHGPFQFHWTALIYFLFGDSDFTARLAPVLFGTALIGLPYLLRHELGRAGAVTAAVLLAISPSFLYFSRFARNDIYIAVWTMLVLIGVFGYLRTRDLRFFYGAAVALALSYATKEVTYITGFILFTAIALALLIRPLREALAPALRTIPIQAWLTAAGIFLVINVVLHTTFFTNPKGLCTMFVSVESLCGGSKGALNYWLEQHDVQRGGQPVYYYAMLLTLYELLPLALAVVGGLALAIWRRGSLFFWFLVYWSLAAFAIYSQAGEKMPWLLLHPALPLLLLASLFLGHLLQRVEWSALRSEAALAAGTLGLVLVACAVAWLGLGVGRTLGLPLDAQTVMLRRVGLGLAIAALAAGLVYLSSRHGRKVVIPSVLSAFGLAAVFFYIHTAWTVTYKHGDIPSEPLVYVQSSPDVPWVVREIERIGFQYGEAKNVGILMDNGWGDGVHESVAWPFEWYLRDYTNKRYFSRTVGPDVDLTRYPIFLVMAPNVEPLQPSLADYHGQKYKLNWWFPEDYKSFDASWRLGPLNVPWLKWDLLWQRLSNPNDRANLLKFLIYRDMPHGGAREFYFYVRNDVPALGPAPFQAGQAPDLQARETVAQPGPNGTTIYGRTAAGKSVLVEPKGVAVDASGRIYVAEAHAHRVTVFNPDGSIAVSWGRQGTGDGQFNEPWGIAIAPNGEVYVADTWNHRIQRFTPDGQFLGKWGRLFDPQKPLHEQFGAFWGPRDVAIAPNGSVYVTDTGNKRIQVFDPRGRSLRAFGQEGEGQGQFREPVGLALDTEGNMLVADTWNNRVQRVDSQGRFLAAYPVEGWESTSVANKPYLAMRGQQLLITQPERGRVLALDLSTGSAQAQGAWQALPSELQLQQPVGVATDAAGQIYVVDSRAGIVIRYPP